MQHQDPQFTEFDGRLTALEASGAPDLWQRLECLLAEVEQFVAESKAKRIEAYRSIGFIAGMQYSESSLDSQLLPLRARIQALMATLTPAPLSDPKLNEFDDRLKIFEKGLSDPSLATLQMLQKDLDRYEIESSEPNLPALLQLRYRWESLFTRLMLPPPRVPIEIHSKALHEDASSPVPRLKEAKPNNTIKHVAFLGSLGLFGYMAFKNAPPEWLDYLTDSIRPKQH